MTLIGSFRKLNPLIILCSFLITLLSVDALAQMRGGWYANQSMMRQNQMMQQQRMAQQRQAAQAAQRQRQLAMQRQQQQRQRAVQAQRQRVQHTMQIRRQAIANQRAAIQKRQRAIQQQRLNAIKSRQSNAPKVLVKPKAGSTRNNTTQNRTLRQLKLAKDRNDRLRKLRMQREKKRLEKDIKQRQEKTQQDNKQNTTNLSLASMAVRSRTINTQPAIRPKNTNTFKQVRQSNRAKTGLVSQKYQQKRDYVQSRAKLLKSLSQNKLTAQKKADSQKKQKTQTAAAKNFGSCDLKTKKCVCSFHGDTGVLTSNGMQKISEITAGDTLVWSKNDKTGDSSWQPVLEHYSNQYESQIHIEIFTTTSNSRQTIVSNKIHPFFVVQTGLRQVSSESGLSFPGNWVQAQDLRSGDVLLTAENTIVEVASVLEHPKPLDAFNIHVANNHTYFVSADISTDNSAVWVHNDCASKTNNALKNNSLKTNRPAFRIAQKRGNADFNREVEKLSTVGKTNVRVLRNWAKSKGWVRKPGNGPETWGVIKPNGQFSYRLKIKPIPSSREGIKDGSKKPRFDARLSEGKYVNPFTGKIISKNEGKHQSLETSYIK